MSDIFAPSRRIVILQGLDADSDRTLSDEMLQRLLGTFGHNVGLDRIREDLRWLERENLVSLGDGAESIVLARLTRRGQDIAAGRERAAGVERPRLD